MAEFDLAVIGAGAAGLSVASVAAKLGLAVLLVERDRMGGDCLNAGCVPSKALFAAAGAAAGARGAARFGIRRSAPPEVDWNAVCAHVASTIEAVAPNDSAARYRALGATVLAGEARFVSEEAIMVDGRRITAHRFVIAAGIRAAVPPIPGLGNVAFLTNASLFGISGPPGHLLILGGGPDRARDGRGPRGPRVAGQPCGGGAGRRARGSRSRGRASHGALRPRRAHERGDCGDLRCARASAPAGGRHRA